MLKGIVYKITQNCDKDKINYIGSTFRNPQTRYQEHKRWAKYKLWNSSSCKVLFDECYSELPKLEILEEIIFVTKNDKKNKQTLRKLEFFHIQNSKNNINVRKKCGDPNSWYGKNKEAIEEKKRNKVMICECGCKINFYYYKKHLQTKKHKIYLDLKNSKKKIEELEKDNGN
jgi:hypothetical protein